MKVKYGISIVVTVVCIVIISFFLIGFSFSIVDYDEIALKRSSTSGVVEKDTYYPGRHHVGLGSHFIRYKSTYQNLEFLDADDNALEVVGRDGQSVTTDFSFEYQIVPETLFQLYTSYGEDGYEEILSQRAVARLKDFAISYTSDDFYLKRAEIETGMKSVVQTLCSELFTNLTSFQLRKIELPSSLEDLLLNNQVQIQSTFLNQAQLQVSAIQQNTSQMVQELANQRILFLQNVGLDYNSRLYTIQSNIQNELQITSRTLQQMDIELQNRIIAYNIDTENLRLAYEQNATQITEFTKQLEAAILNNITILQAQNNAAIKQIRVSASSQADLIVKEAQAKAQGFILEVERSAFNDIVQAMNFTFDEGLEKLWVDVFETQSSSIKYFDLHKPNNLWLSGERELYIRSLGQTP